MNILCIGHAAYDLTLPLKGFPKENEKYAVEKSMEMGGGPAANAAYLLSKWGISTGFLGLVGDDVYGNRIIKEFQEVGTDLSLLRIEKNYPTPFSAILINEENGSRTIINRKKPHRGVDLDRGISQKIQPKVLLVDGHEFRASLQALEAFPDAISILDAGSLRKATKELARKVDYVVASETFAKEYSRMGRSHVVDDYYKCIKKLKEICPGQVVVTLGERGLIYENEGKVFKMDAYSSKALDTTGAGDIFHGAFAYGVLKGFSLIENLKFSSATSSLSVEQLGGRSSIPSLGRVWERMNE